MHQVTRFFPLTISGVTAGTMGYYGSVDAAQRAFNAECARIHTENSDPSNVQRGKEIQPTLLGIFSSLVNVPDLRDLDEFTKGFILKYIELRSPDAIVTDLLHHLGPDTIVYFDHWCRWFQSSDQWLVAKDETLPDGTLIWEPKEAGAFIYDMLATGAVLSDRYDDFSEDIREGIEAHAESFLTLAQELPEFSTKEVLYERRVIWSVVYTDDNDLA